MVLTLLVKLPKDRNPLRSNFAIIVPFKKSLYRVLPAMPVPVANIIVP